VLALAAIVGTEVEAYIWMMVAIAILAIAATVFAAIALRRRATGPAHAGG
jgi:heme exporter protein D